MNPVAVSNLSLCGCGFLGIYHLGVGACLMDHAPGLVGNLQRVGGASAGALAGAALLFGRDKLNQSVQFSYKLVDEIRGKPLGAMTPRYNLMDRLYHFIGDMLPSNAHTIATGKLYISLSPLIGRNNEVVSEFVSRDHLIKCLVATSYIPIYGGVNPPSILGKRYIDGGITNNLIQFQHGRTITVSPFAGKQDICPQDKIGRGLFIRFRKQNYQINRRNVARIMDAFMPPPREVMQWYYDRGYREAEVFLRSEGLYEFYETIIVPKETTV